MNAKDELLDALPEGRRIIAAMVEYIPYDDAAAHKTLMLPKGHTANQLEGFLESLNFDYDNGYGLQELYGTVWLSDGSWLRRGEYDGSEWWAHMSPPPIPPELAGGVPAPR